MLRIGGLRRGLAEEGGGGGGGAEDGDADASAGALRLDLGDFASQEVDILLLGGSSEVLRRSPEATNPRNNCAETARNPGS